MLIILNDPFPILESERLLLRQMTDTDEKSVFDIRSTDVSQYVERKPIETMEEAEAFIKRIAETMSKGLGFYWLIERKEDAVVMGSVGLWNFDVDSRKAEIGYEIMPAYGGKGYMQEATAAVINYAKQGMNAARIEAFTHPDNGRSLRVLEKNHFKRDVEIECTLSKEDLGHYHVYALSL